jgi:hypothetical protein
MRDALNDGDFHEMRTPRITQKSSKKILKKPWKKTLLENVSEGMIIFLFI